MQTVASSDWAGGTLPGVMAGKRPPRSAKLALPVILLALFAQATTYCVATEGKEVSPSASGLPPRAIQAGTDNTGPSRVAAPLARTHKETGTSRQSGTGGLPVGRPAESTVGADSPAAVDSIDPGSAEPGADAVMSPEPQYINTYYVAPGGNDTNPGTYELPLRTIQAGVNKAYAGDRVYVRAGTYKEQVTFPRSGETGWPITLQGEVDGARNPLAIIDNTDSVGTTWTAAPEVGEGVYKKTGFAAKLMLWNGDQILKINAPHMAGDSDQYCDKGFNILNYPADKIWHPGGSASCSTAFWDDVEAIYGVLNSDTTYIRFRNGDDPDTCDLWATTTATVGINLNGDDHITVKNLRIQGCVTSIQVANSDNCIIDSNVLRHGNTRIRVASGSANNLIKGNDLSYGYGSYAMFGEWGDKNEDAVRRYAMYILGKWCEGNSSSVDKGIAFIGCGTGNEVEGNSIADGSVGLSFWSAPNVSIHNNTIQRFSSVGFYMDMGVKDISIYDNAINHCNGGIRFGSLGAAGDTNRSGWVYNNTAYNEDGSGQFLITHVGGSNYASPPDFWFYHNSYSNGAYFGQALYGPCGRMKFVNNIMSGRGFMAGAGPADDTMPDVFAAFDYNFMGGQYRGYRYFKWAATDSHNLWAADTLRGDINHQVWPLGTEPDWNVPETSAAFCSGLDLSDSFTIRGVTYGPLPGMTEGYFTGIAPNLGAAQNTGRVGTPQDDSGRGSVMRPLELAFAPNPAAGRDVMVQCAVPVGKVGELTMRDVLGRAVKTFTLDPSGQTRLDLRGFAPGIYVAVLDAAGPPVSRKLIVARRD